MSELVGGSSGGDSHGGPISAAAASSSSKCHTCSGLGFKACSACNGRGRAELVEV